MRLSSLTQNLPLKLVSLVAAILIFLVVTWETGNRTKVKYRIKYNLPKKTMRTNNPPPLLEAELQGPLATIRSFDTEDLERVVIDLTSADVGLHPGIQISKDLITPPAGMKVVKYEPQQVDVEIDWKETRKVPVKPDIDGSPPFGFDMAKPSVQPPSVNVTGPLETFEAEDRKAREKFHENFKELDFEGVAELEGFVLETLKIDIRDRTESFEQTVELIPIEHLNYDVDQVQVTVEINETIVERAMEKRVKVINAPKGTRLSPETVTVTLKGPQRIVDKLEKKAVDIVVDALPEAEEGQRRFSKSVLLREPPEGTELLAPAPTVMVELPRQSRRRRR